MARPIGTGTFLSIVAAVFLAAFGASLLLPHDPYIRYQSFKGTIFERLEWVYDRIAHDDTPIDVVLMGSSRTARGANAAAISAELAALGREDVHIANLSEPAAGMDIRLSKLRDAFAKHDDIKLVVMGVVEALPRDGHQAFGQLATPGDILRAPWLINRNLPVNIAALPYRQMELMLATALPDAFGYKAAFDPETYPGPAPDHRSFNRPDWADVEAGQGNPVAHATALERETAMRRREITPPILPDALSGLEFGVSRHYIEEIAALTEAEGAELVFLFLPFYQGYDAPLDADWLSKTAPIWNAGFIRRDPANYFDAAHASSRGVAALAPWLAQQIDAQLESTP